MTTDKKISIHAKVPVQPFIEALKEYLSTNTLDDAKITEMLSGYFSGDYVRHRSLLHVKAAIANPDFKDFFSANKEELLAALNNDREAKFIYFALICARYKFPYYIAVELAKLFRLEDMVSKDLLKKNIGKVYGYNESVRRSLDQTINIFEDAEVVNRPIKYTFAQLPALKPQFPVTIELWKLAYMANEPLASVDDISELQFEPFFRYLKLI